MAQGEAWGSRARLCAVHAERPLELFCKDCGDCVGALCPALGPHRGHRASLLRDAVCRKQAYRTKFMYCDKCFVKSHTERGQYAVPAAGHGLCLKRRECYLVPPQGTCNRSRVQKKMELMPLCLEDLEKRKEQEAGNRRSIEQAANDQKAHAIMSKRHLSDRMTELQLLLREGESLAKNFIGEKTQQTLEAHNQQLESCQEKLEALETLSVQIRQIQQQSDPIQFSEVKYTEIKKEMEEPGHLIEQWHPIPLSFEHVLNYYKHLVRAHQAILQKPLEARFKKDASSPTWEYDSLHPRLKLIR